jgi:hypothetical protein
MSHLKTSIDTMYLLLRDTHNFCGREAVIIIPLANIRRVMTTSTEVCGRSQTFGQQPACAAFTKLELGKWMRIAMRD